MKPTVVVVCGPNGAGKTTLSRDLTSGQIVNPDEIAKELDSPSAIEAGRRALVERRRLLERGTSFSLETTLSGRRELAFVREAQARGYAIELRYVGVESAALCRVRIADRVTKGGHHVPDEDLFRRFERSIVNLPAAIALAHESFVYDNSTLAGVTLVARFSGGRLVECAPNVPRWMERAIGPLLKRDDL